MIEVSLVQKVELYEHLTFPGATHGRFDIEVDSVTLDETVSEQDIREIRLGLVALCSSLFDDISAEGDEYANFVSQVLDGYLKAPHVTRILPFLKGWVPSYQGAVQKRMNILSKRHLNGELTTEQLARERELLSKVEEPNNIQVIDSSGRLSEWDSSADKLIPRIFDVVHLAANDISADELEEIVGVSDEEVFYYYQFPVYPGNLPTPNHNVIDRSDMQETAGYKDEQGNFIPVVTFLNSEHYDKVESSSHYAVRKIAEGISWDDLRKPE